MSLWLKGMETGMEKAMTNVVTMTPRTTTKITTGKPCADGMTSMKTIFRQDLPKGTACPLDWKNNLFGAARCRQVSRNGCNLARETWNDSCLRLPLNALIC